MRIPGFKPKEEPEEPPRPALDVIPGDTPPPTTGEAFVHENGRRCLRVANLIENRWWPEWFEDGELNKSAGTICLMEHTTPNQEPIG